MFFVFIVIQNEKMVFLCVKLSDYYSHTTAGFT